MDTCSGAMHSYKLSKGQYMYADLLALVDVPGWWKCLYECGYIHRRSQHTGKRGEVSRQSKKLASPRKYFFGCVWVCLDGDDVWTMGVSGSECV